jgi:hypothetical protein
MKMKQAEGVFEIPVLKTVSERESEKLRRAWRKLRNVMLQNGTAHQILLKSEEVKEDTLSGTCSTHEGKDNIKK